MIGSTPEEKAKYAEKMLTALAAIRLPFESQIDNIIEFVQHSRRKITDKDTLKGQKTGIKVYDGTAVSGLNLLTDGLCGHTASPSFRWFGYTLPDKWNFPRYLGMRAWSGKRMDEYPEVKEYLRDAEDVAYSTFARSNFYDAIPDFIRDGASIGTVTMLIEEDLAADRIVFSVPHFRECYIAENKFGVVDTNYRVCKFTLTQLVDKFGWKVMEKVDPNFKNLYESNPYSEKEVLHTIYPRNAYDPKRIDNKSFKFASEWYLRGPSMMIGRNNTTLLLESGYEDMASITWRWRKNLDEPYGRSPCWDAYVDIMTANQQGKTNLVAGHKMVAGPMIATEDMRGKVMNEPDGWTFVERDLPPDRWPRPLNEKIQLPYAVEQQDRTSKSIREHLHVDFFLMLYQAAFNRVDLTATQVIGMQAEQAAILGTRVGRLSSEAYNPIHDRVFYIKERQGRMPEPPQILLDYAYQLSQRENRTIKIEIDYLGPLAQAQKRLFKQQSLNAGTEFLVRMATVSPDAVDRVNIDQAVIEGLDAVSWPANCLNSDEKVAAIRAQRQQQQQAMAEVAQIGELSKASRNLGKTVEPGSIMESLKGALEGGAGGEAEA